MKLPQHKGLVKLPFEVRINEQCGLNLKQCPCCEKETLVLIAIHLPWKKWDDGIEKPDQAHLIKKAGTHSGVYQGRFL
jgi:hypothetical protein